MLGEVRLGAEDLAKLFKRKSREACLTETRKRCSSELKKA